MAEIKYNRKTTALERLHKEGSIHKISMKVK